MSTAPRISAILPAHNEEGVIAGVVQRTAAALLDSRVPEPEIVVVDDGSTDRTAELVASVSTPGVATRVVSHQVNRGYGAALRTGFESANERRLARRRRRRAGVCLQNANGREDVRVGHFDP